MLYASEGLVQDEIRIERGSPEASGAMQRVLKSVDLAGNKKTKNAWHNEK